MRGGGGDLSRRGDTDLLPERRRSGWGWVEMWFVLVWGGPLGRPLVGQESRPTFPSSHRQKVAPRAATVVTRVYPKISVLKHLEFDLIPSCPRKIQKFYAGTTPDWRYDLHYPFGVLRTCNTL